MKSKKLIVLLIAGAMITASLTACTGANTDVDATQAPTQVVTQEVTNEVGETVTEVVTDKNGDTVTEVVSTTEATTTTTTTTTKPTSTTKPKVKMENGTTKKQSNQSTTKKQTTTKKKVTTTQPVDNSISIVLERNRMASCKSPNVSIATGEVVIDKPGDYVFTQKTGAQPWHGQIIIKLKNTEKASLRFENVHISNDTKNIIQILDTSIKSNRSFLEAEASIDTPALDNALQDVADNDKAPNVSISFPRDTSSTFETKANAFTGVIYNESKLTIKGNGAATITSKVNANNCICTTKSITIKNVGLTLETAQNTTSESLAKTTGSAKGIYSYSKVTVEDAFLTIKSNGDAIRCDRFYMNGGTSNLKSSACDAIDADDSIIIKGGTTTAIALNKYSFKVRRVNNTENGEAKGTVRAGKGDCFKINGGTVRGESKKITSLDRHYQSDKKGSLQPNITAKIIKQNAGNPELSASESKVPAIITVGNWKSNNACTKFLYSSSAVEKGKEYTGKANGNSAKVSWAGNAGVVTIKNSTNQ